MPSGRRAQHFAKNAAPRRAGPGFNQGYARPVAGRGVGHENRSLVGWRDSVTVLAKGLDLDKHAGGAHSSGDGRSGLPRSRPIQPFRQK